MTYGNLSSIRMRLNLSSGSGFDDMLTLYQEQAERWILEQTEEFSISTDTLKYVEEDYTAYLYRSQQIELFEGGTDEAKIFKARAEDLLKFAINRASTEETEEGGGIWGIVRVRGV